MRHLFPVFVCFWFCIVALIAAFFFSCSSFSCVCVFLVLRPSCVGATRLWWSPPFFLSTKQKKARNSGPIRADFKTAEPSRDT